MVARLVSQSFLSRLPITKPFLAPQKSLILPNKRFGFNHNFSGFKYGSTNYCCSDFTRTIYSTRFYRTNAGKSRQKENQRDWPIFKRWNVPWEWQTISLTALVCGNSFVWTDLTLKAATSFLGFQYTELSMDGKAELLFVNQAITSAVVLGAVYSLTYTFQPRDDLYRYDFRKPFNLKKGWLLWAGIGLTGTVAAMALTGVAIYIYNGGPPQRGTDAVSLLLPLIGSSNFSTACVIGITGVLAPILEETVFRDFLMVSLTKWLPTPVSILISAAAFAVVHLSPSQFPQLFVFGTALGLSYAKTRNLLTPIIIHALWNSAMILFLSFLVRQGYDVKKLLRIP